MTTARREYRTPAYRDPEYVGRVAEAIREAIQDRGWSHLDVERIVGVERQAAQRAVRGHHLSAPNQDRLLDALGLVVGEEVETP